MKRIAIVGGGAAGMMAAITAARENAQVTVYERNDRVGKKILATGNGKCNFTNLHFSFDCFFSDSFGKGQSGEVIKAVFSEFGVQETIAFFEELGLCVKNRNGYLYPASEQATTVLDLLRLELDRLGVLLKTEEKIADISGLCKEYDAVILACGSKAAPKTGSDGLGYQLARKAGHHIIEPLPALVQLRCKEKFFKAIAGIRMEAKVTLVVNGKALASDQGELQINDYGISGIPVFQISRNAAKALHQKKTVEVLLDLLPNQKEEEIPAFVEKRLANNSHKTMEEFLYGMLHKKMIGMLLKENKIEAGMPVRKMKKEKLIQLLSSFKKLCVQVEATNPFENAQVCSGGVDLEEVSVNLESKLQKNLFFAGEILDVDGKCGGYNLQWAWSSGYVAGKSAAKSHR